MLDEQLPQSLTDALSMLADGRLFALELADALLERIHTSNPHLQAYLSVCESHARGAARAVDTMRRSHPTGLGPLAGLPLSVKDLIDTSFAATTYGSRQFRNHRPTKSATVVERLERAHAIILGKTHLHEFAFGVTNENPHFGHARNPVDPTRITGGSSGGSAASVRANLALASVGTDSGGSIRIPASLVGVVGFKPSHGLIPTEGVFPLAPTLDHVGPITRTVTDAALLTDVMAGHSKAQSLSAHLENRYNRPIRVGISQDLVDQFASDGVGIWFEQMVHTFEMHGLLQYAASVTLDASEIAQHQSTIMGAQALEVHMESMEANGTEYGADVYERLQAAQSVSAQAYIRALKYREQFQSNLERWFDQFDVLMLPTTPVTATPIGDSTVRVRGTEVGVRQLLTRFTNPWNLSGFPAISLPGGTVEGLPIGLQLVGRFGEDAKLLCIAKTLEPFIKTEL